MKFCPECRNMLYEMSVVEGVMSYRCRKCSYSEPVSAMVYEHKLQEDTTAQFAANPYLKEDPTLPRFTTIRCPNASCPSKSDGKNDVVGVKVDATNVVWMYQCARCETTWKQSARST